MWILIFLGIIAIVLPVWNYSNETSTNRLRNLLAAKKWKQANEETERLLVLISARFVYKRLALQSTYELRQFFRSIGLGFVSNFLIYKLTAAYTPSLSPEDIRKFPCSFIKVIDQLWTQYSGGHFGFSVQSRIYEECKTTDNFTRKQIEAYRKVFKETMSTEILMAYSQFGWGYIQNLNLNNILQPQYFFKIDDMANINYSLNAPRGCLPVLSYHDPMIGIYMSEWWQRIKDCGR